MRAPNLNRLSQSDQMMNLMMVEAPASETSLEYNNIDSGKFIFNSIII